MDSKERLTVLLSAMHLKDKSIIDDLAITSDCIVINQCDSKGDENLIDSGRSIRFVSVPDRGLSKSRNLAVSLADGGICLYCDNDVKYHEDYQEKVLGAYRRHPEADIIVFFIRRPERQAPVARGDVPLTYLRSMKIFSPEISFKKESLERAGLKMDEEFGAGARYGMGEENIFLFDAIRKGLKVWYVGEEIASLKPQESTWFKGYDKEFFMNRGAGYYRMSKTAFPILALQFAVRKRSLYTPDGTGFTRALKYMFEGKNEYIRTHHIPGR